MILARSLILNRSYSFKFKYANKFTIASYQTNSLEQLVLNMLGRSIQGQIEEEH